MPLADTNIWPSPHVLEDHHQQEAGYVGYFRIEVHMDGKSLTESERRWYDLAATHADDFATKAAQHDRDNTFAIEAYEAMRESGYTNMSIPEEFGGEGASLREVAIAQNRLAQGDGPTTLAINMHLAKMVMLNEQWQNGDESMRPLLERIGRERLISSGAISESEVETLSSIGSMLYSVCTAERADGGYIVNGRKAFGTGTIGSDIIDGSARFDDGADGMTILMFSVPRDLPGLRCLNDWNTMGMRATSSHSWVYENAFVAEERITAYRKPYQWDEHVRSLLSLDCALFGTIYLGIAKAARDFAVTYTKQRTRIPHDYPASYYPKNQFLAAEMDIGLNVAWAAQLQMAGTLSDLRARDDQTLADGIGVQYFSMKTAIDVVSKAVDMVGGAALSKGMPLERYYRDVRAGPIHPVGAYDALEIIGKHAFGIPRDSVPRWV